MALFENFSIIRKEDALLSISLNPPVSIAGWSLEFRVNKRFGSCSGLIIKSANLPTFNNVSGINVTNTAQGMFQVTLNSVDTSGFDFGNYAYGVQRLNAGNVTALSEGFLILLPSINC